MQLRIATACTAPLHPVQLHATAQPAPTPILPHATALLRISCNCISATALHMLLPCATVQWHSCSAVSACSYSAASSAAASCTAQPHFCRCYCPYCNYCAALKVLPVQQQYSCGCCCPCSCATALMHCHMLLLCNAQCRGSMQLLGCTSADASATCLVAPMPTSAPRPKHRPGA